MSKFSAVLTSLMLLASSSALRAEGPVKGVVELFTSQGCSSCPPADTVFGGIIKQDGVIGLAWHVDYWDYLGWKDTFSLEEATARQRSYAQALNARNVYTPQIIVNGEKVAKNSNFSGTIASALDGVLPVSVDMEVGADRVTVAAGEGDGEANLVLVTYERMKNVNIERGENSGSKITYYHAVSNVRTIGMWKGAAMSLELPRSEYAPKKGQGCAVLLQRVVNGAPGAIIGAYMMDAPES